VHGTNKIYYQYYERMREALEKHLKKQDEFNKSLKMKLKEKKEKDE